MLALLNLQVLMKSYIPSELVAEKKGELFDALITLLQANVSKDPIVDQLFDFLATKDNISTAIEWLKNSQITIEGEAIYFVRTRQKHDQNRRRRAGLTASHPCPTRPSKHVCGRKSLT